MSDTLDAIRNRGYHAHIYYTIRKEPARLPSGSGDVIGQQFQVQFGGFRDEPVGPHPVANVQVIFAPEQFQPVVEWLMLHRDGLDVLIHPLTDNSLDDHSYAMWLGSPVLLKPSTPCGARTGPNCCRAPELPPHWHGAASSRAWLWSCRCGLHGGLGLGRPGFRPVGSVPPPICSAASSPCWPGGAG